MNRPRPRSLLLVLAAVAAAVVGLVAPASAAPYCGIDWGSGPKADADTSADGVTVEGLRAGRHACFDRLVIDLSRYDGLGGYTVGYGQVVGADGVAVPLRGAADLSVVVHAPAYDSTGNLSYAPQDRQEAVPVAGYDTFRQVAWVGSFEGHTELGIGTRARLPFRVLVLPGTPTLQQGARLVIDVAHRW